MARDHKTSAPEPDEKPAETPAPKTGTERVQYVEGKWRVPAPQIEKPIQQSGKAPEKKPDPHKPKDAHVPTAHLVESLAGKTALIENRLSRLTELANQNNDVKWLLTEYKSKTKSK